MIETLPNRSPRKGEITIEAVVFDTYGTVLDFYHPMRREFEALAISKGVECDAGRMAIDWRTAYVFSTLAQAVEESEFRPLRAINRANLEQLLAKSFPAPVKASELDAISRVWEKLDPWPEAVEGLREIKQMAIIAPLSNGNFADMVRVSRYGKLPWDIILGSSVSGFYKPHPDTYLKSVAALALKPEQVCMVAAHNADLAYAAGHRMQTAFVARPDEFGGSLKPKDYDSEEPCMDAAEMYPEGDWTFVAEDFLDLASQIRTANP